MLWKSDIADVLRRSGVDEPLPSMSMNDFPPMEPELDMLYPDKIVPWNLFRYSVNKVNEFLALVYYFLVGKDDATDVGYISFMLPEVVEKEAKEHRDKVMERIEGTYGRFVERKSREALAMLIAAPKEWKAEHDGLEALQQDLGKIRAAAENALKL